MSLRKSVFAAAFGLTTAAVLASGSSAAPAPGMVLVGSPVSDRTPTAATNGWGPVELNMSVGDKAAGDGRTLTINGKTYSKGLGVHAPSDITYALDGSCSRFQAEVGIDAEKAPKGSLAFQVFADGAKVYDSGLVTAATATKTVDAAIDGATSVRLVVTNGGDNINNDHADWANATLVCAVADTVAPTSPANLAAGTAS